MMLLALFNACATDASDLPFRVIDTEAYAPTLGLEPLEIDERGRAADAVFAGKVVDISYRESEPDVDGSSLPFTYVTYAVDSAWKGVSVGEKFTIMMVGGRLNDGRFLSVSEFPDFQLGDRDVLFVEQNGVAGCPLVGCMDGRFRLVEGRVYTEGGVGVIQAADGKLAHGGWQNLPELNVVEVAGQIVERHPDEEAGPGPDGMEEPLFTSLLAARVSDSGSAAVSANPAESVTVRLPPQ